MGGTLPLTLDCFCPDADIGVCDLAALTFVVNITQSLIGTPEISAGHTLTLYANKDDPMAPTVVMTDPADGEYEFDLTLADWAALWEHYSVELETDSGLSQIPSPAYSAYDQFWATYYIRQDYVCFNPSSSETTTPSQKAYTKDPHDNTICEPTTGDIKTVCYAGQGVGSLFYKSTPLGPCNGCTITDKDFEPAVVAIQRIDISSGSWCLCASGGSGSYKYQQGAGILPCGMSLDFSSGCITGKPDGKCTGSPIMYFSAVDLVTHESAQVACGVLGLSCGGASGFGNQAY